MPKDQLIVQIVLQNILVPIVESKQSIVIYACCHSFSICDLELLSSYLLLLHVADTIVIRSIESTYIMILFLKKFIHMKL